MGSTISLPSTTANSIRMGVPTAVETHITPSFVKATIMVTCLQTGRQWLAVMPRGYSGPLIIYDGNSEQYSPMVVINHMDMFHLSFSIELPAFPAEYRDRSTHIFNWYDKFIKNDIYWFDFPTSYGGLPERFEWRRSLGNEVVGLGRLDWLSKGWKLVRAPIAPSTTKVERKYREPGVSSDGGEIVGVWVSRHSFSKKGHFELLGSGLQFGQSFALMALASALTLEANVIRLKRQRRSNNGMY